MPNWRAAILEALKARGQVVEERSPWGNANLIVVQPNNTLEGAADPRGEGSAVHTKASQL